MKKFISIPLICWLMLFWSCSEDFLERYPLDELSPQEYFRTANDLKLYANSFYTLLPSHSGYGGGTFWAEQNSDNMVPAVPDKRLSGIRTIPSTGGGWDWSTIREANYFFDNCYENLEDTLNGKIYIAEVKFFKAFLYFDKLKTFGDVPWFTRALTTDSPELFAPRDSRKVVTDSIIACLDFAIANLNDISATEPFRINKETAILLKARVCLYEGTWEKYHQGTPFGVAGEDGSEYLQMAAETADRLMQMETLSLYQGPQGEEYWSLFNQLDYTGNPEVLLWKKYDIGLEITHYLGQYLPNAGGDIGITKTFADSYLCNDGLPISVSPLFLGYDSLSLEAQNRDPRFAQTIFLPGDLRSINRPENAPDLVFDKPPLDQVGQWRATTGYCLYKGVNTEYSQQEAAGWMGSIIFRYAEALLIYAESVAELGTISQDDIDKTVNRLRDRVGMIHLDLNNITNDPDWDFPNLTPIINEIRRERRIELAFEDVRWDDVARWRAHNLIVNKRLKGVKYIGSNLEDTYFAIDGSGDPSLIIGENLFVDENGLVDPYQKYLPSGFNFNPARDYLSPIPSDEITLNSNLVQNPGWE
jgi:hypothetical protein